METGQGNEVGECRIVVGPAETAAARSAWPDTPIVALVEASEPEQAVFARSAGADVVLPTTDLAAGWRNETPGLAVAVSTAISLAQRRVSVRDCSSAAAHDLGQTLSAINLAAELAIGDSAKNDRLLHQIRDQAQEAGGQAWRAGRAGRQAGLALGPVDLSAVLHRLATTETDVAVYDSSGSAWVLGDLSRTEHLLEELIQHGRQSASSQRIDVTIGSGARVEITLRGMGQPRSALPRRDVEFGLMALGEIVNDLGGKLHVNHSSDTSDETANGTLPTEHRVVRLSLPLLPFQGRQAGLVEVPPDRMAIQADILEGVLRHAPLPESLEAIVAAIERQLPGSVCSILLLDDELCLHHGAGSSLPEAYRNEIDGVAIGFGQGSCGTAAFLGEPVIAADVETNSHWVDFKEIALQHNLRSCWSTPILAADGGAVLGTFAVYRPEIWEPDVAATSLVSRFTYLAAVAIGHHRLFNAVAESESRFRSAFEGATAGMALVGLDGSFLKVNPALCGMLDTTAVDLCGMNVLHLVDPPHRDRITRSWDDCHSRTPQATGSEQEVIEVPIADKAGDEQLWVSMRSSLVGPDSGAQEYLYIEIRDITAAKRHAAERRAREVAEAASQAKTDFLALVSHELRTPLNAILGFAQVMKLVDLDPTKQQESVDSILKAGQHLLYLINDLLDLSLIEACQFSTRIEDLDAGELIDEALQILRPLADSSGIELHHGLAPRLAEKLPDEASIECGPGPFVLRADRQGVLQVLINLLGNAVKFTPSGGHVGITVSTAPSAMTPTDTVRIHVFDSGPGIPPHEIDSLFEPFHRLEPDGHPSAEGTGLGLSVAARLVEEMNGSIGVQSWLGTGSRFWVDLPQGHDPAREPARSGAPATGRVLYIEDDPASVQVIATALELRPGVELMTAATAADGLAATQAHSFDAILLDIGLPDGSGWDVLGTLHQQVETASVPVVVLTAGPDLAPQGVPIVHSILAKPLDISACLHTIDDLLGAETAQLMMAPDLG